MGAETALDAVVLRAALTGGDVAPGVFEDIASGVTAEFPVRASDLPDRLEGPALGKALRWLERDWIASGFALDRSALIARARGLH